jgi:hypothetical protein
MQIPISIFWNDWHPLKFKFGLHAPMFQPIDAPWGSNIGREPNVSGEEHICSARKHRCAQRVENGPSQER